MKNLLAAVLCSVSFRAAGELPRDERTLPSVQELMPDAYQRAVGWTPKAKLYGIRRAYHEWQLGKNPAIRWEFAFGDRERREIIYLTYQDGHLIGQEGYRPAGDYLTFWKNGAWERQERRTSRPEIGELDLPIDVKFIDAPRIQQILVKSGFWPSMEVVPSKILLLNCGKLATGGAYSPCEALFYHADAGYEYTGCGGEFDPVPEELRGRSLWAVENGVETAFLDAATGKILHRRRNAKKARDMPKHFEDRCPKH